MAPCILLIDDLDCLTPSSLPSSSLQQTDPDSIVAHIVAMLCRILDEINDPGLPFQSSFQAVTENIFVLAAVTNLDKVDPRLRRSGRFDRLIGVPLPCERQRKEILQKLCRKICISEEGACFSKDLQGNGIREKVFSAIAARTNGFSPADLQRLCQEFVIIMARKRVKSSIIPADMPLPKLDGKTIEAGLAVVRPSRLTGVSIVHPSEHKSRETNSNQLIGMDRVLSQLRAMVQEPFKRLQRCSSF